MLIQLTALWLRRLWLSWPGTPSTSAPKSVSSRSSIPGAKTSFTTLTCTVLFPEAGCRWMEGGGSTQKRSSLSRSRFSPGNFAASFWRFLNKRFKTARLSPWHVLRYLGRYTHRVAITNNRFVDISNGRVSFRWRDYREGHRTKVMYLEAAEFIRRFLLHVLPERFRSEERRVGIEC